MKGKHMLFKKVLSLSRSLLSPLIGVLCGGRMVGDFFKGDVMQIKKIDINRYELFFDEVETTFLQNEARNNNLTIIEIFEMILGQLFIAGYRVIVGKG